VARTGRQPETPGQKRERPMGEVFTFSTWRLRPHFDETVWRNVTGSSSWITR
jgi:hypothetical protein